MAGYSQIKYHVQGPVGLRQVAPLLAGERPS